MSYRSQQQHPPRGSSNNGGGGGGYQNDRSYSNSGYDNRQPSHYDRGYDDRGAPPRGYNDRGASSRGYDDRNAAPAPSSSKWASAAQAAETQNQSGYASSGYKGWENGWLQRKTKKVQNDSLETSRKALAKLNQSEAVASSSLNKLNKQSEQLYNIEHKLDQAENKSKISEAKTSELRSLNRFFMIPAFEKYKQDEEAALERETERRERIQNVLDTSQNNNFSYHERFDEDGRQKREGRGQKLPDNWKNNGNAYTTPDGLERDETETEIDSNLDQISSGLARLRMMGRTMNSELEHQNGHIAKIADKTDSVRDRVDRTTEKVNRMVKRK
ncbi:hypothetical protein BC829DRAFT_386014 [Chytridium lagenaria]|nr:hypothetical protein BC829DRAFT_386014 [Chytridium lagenaria]